MTNHRGKRGQSLRRQAWRELMGMVSGRQDEKAGEVALRT